MKTLSTSKLAETVRRLREEKGYTQEKLGNMTGINRIMLGKIEKEKYIPSISQFESLSGVLGFDITDMFIDKDRKNSFVALRGEVKSIGEKEGIEKLFTMMLALRQQIQLRRSYENENDIHGQKTVE
jgi:transcriptional regulator with XRE-family HTH domain